jgi:alkylated DNA nucleotide flippase Atl1
MNQEIAEQERWSRPQIHARADALAERVIAAWPAPAERAAENSGPAWDVINQVLAALPAGSWTTYGDLAALIGSHAVAVGQRLATAVTPNAHRVLQSDGKVSPNFAWVDLLRTEDPGALLEAEGLPFDSQGRAEPERRFATDQLALLLGAEIPDRMPEIPPGQDPQLRDRFRAQLLDRQGPDITRAVAEVINAWADLGGHLEYGIEEETSCFLMSRVTSEPGGNIWPVVVYPSGKFEIVFQHLVIRAPFAERSLREELRQRLNQIDGANLPETKLEQRPGFPLELLADQARRQTLVEVLGWFHNLARSDALASDGPAVW